MDFEKEPDKHESYALVAFSRVTSNQNHNLFGSSIKHNYTITLSISRAQRRRDLSREWFFPREEIIEVEMSQTQFAELISSLNCGSGIPATIRRLQGQDIEDPPYYNQRQLFEDEFKEKAKDVGCSLENLFKEFQSIMDGKLSKDTLKKFAKKLRMVAQDVSSNMPFVQSSFNESMDKTVTEAKGEVESFVLNKLTALGIEALKNEMPKIEQDPVIPTCDSCNFKSADCAHGDLRGGQSCIDLLKKKKK